MLVEANQNESFYQIISNADVNCPDGYPVAWSIRCFHRFQQKRTAGPDMLPRLMDIAGKEGKRIFLLGTTEDIIHHFIKEARKKHPNTIICGYDCPPFRQATQDEDIALIQKINDSKADMIFVALGCPKQERWMAAHKGKVHGCMFGLGYAIPVYAMSAKRAPHWMSEHGLEWFFRLISNPRRLFKRYIKTNTTFVYLSCLEQLHLHHKAIN